MSLVGCRGETPYGSPSPSGKLLIPPANRFRHWVQGRCPWWGQGGTPAWSPQTTTPFFIDILVFSFYNKRIPAMMGRNPSKAIKESTAPAESRASPSGWDTPEPPARAGASQRYGKESGRAFERLSFKLGGTAKRTSSHAHGMGVFFYRRGYNLCSHRHPKAQRICCPRTHISGNM